MDYKTMPSEQNVQGFGTAVQNISGSGQSQNIGDMAQELDYNRSKQEFGSNTLRPLNDDNNNRNEMPEFGADEKVLNNNGDDEPEGPKNPEIPSEGDPTPVENPIVS